MMIENELELTKDFPPIDNKQNATPKWVGWFNLISIAGILIFPYIIAKYLYGLRIYAPESFSSTLGNYQWFVVVILYFSIFAVLLSLYNVFHKRILTKELFTGATDYILAYKDTINLREIFEIDAKRIPLGTNLYIFAYNRMQEAELSKSSLVKGRQKYERNVIEEAKAQGVDLNLEQYPLMDIKKSQDYRIGNVNLLKKIELPFKDTNTKLAPFLPESINLRNLPNDLLMPSFDGTTLTEVAVRVLIYSKNEQMALFEAFFNPMETAFCDEI